VASRPDLASALRARIQGDGPISVADWMEACNSAYYAKSDPLGREGDFITSPEISQCFGEIIGLFLADLWRRAGSPAPFSLVELGPGRGTLMADALRAAALQPGFAEAARLHLVETSPTLRARQAENLSAHAPEWHDRLEDVPDDAPLILIANEFFDALPVRQFTEAETERRIEWREGFAFTETGPFRETSPASLLVAAEIGRRLSARGIGALVIDYGYAGPAMGDTLQAMRGHRYAPVLETPGEADLTCHVDFTAIAEAALAEGAVAHPLADQGDFLESLGIWLRARRLAESNPARAGDILSGVERLTDREGMGGLFKALLLTGAFPA
jgi:NADH dehydrogenase [ubiquinone] 1 alpha subcomplex assembly factor 7